MSRAGSFTTVALDACFVVGFFLLQPLMTKGFASSNVLWGVIVVVGYLVLCISTWMLMRLKPHVSIPQQVKQPDTDTPQSMDYVGNEKSDYREKHSGNGCLSFLALCFGLMVVVMLIELSGALEKGGLFDQLSENDPAKSGLALGTFVLSLLYFFVVIIKPKPVIPTGTTTYCIQRLIATAGISVMFIITLSYWNSSFADNEPMDLALGGRILVFLLTYVVMLIFLAPPRLILHSIEGNSYGLISFCFWLGVYSWKLII